MANFKKFLYPVSVVVFSTVLTLAALEIGLRFLPVSTGLNSMPTNAQSPVFKAHPNRDFVHSVGWDFKLVNEGHVNNAGFVNDQDYTAQGARPLIAVIGDSYIEAQMVPYAQTLQGRMADYVDDEGRVYSFAFSGAPPSQYLKWAEFARDAYAPDAMVFVIVGNDYDENLMEYKSDPGFHYYAPDAQGDLQLERVDYEPSWIRQLGRMSALVRYAFFNLKIRTQLYKIETWLASRKPEQEFKGNSFSNDDPLRFKKTRRAFDAFFRDLPVMAGLPPEKILFVFDGFRDAVYEPELYTLERNNYWRQMRAKFMDKADSLGYQVIDMDAHFKNDYAVNGRRFESPHDWHWNGYGHQVVFRSVKQSGWLDDILQSNQGD